MADRSPKFSKKSTQNHKKQKNKARIRRSSSSISPKCADRSNSSREEKRNKFVRSKFSEDNNEDLFTFESRTDNRDPYTSKNRIQRYSSIEEKHNRHESPNFDDNRVFSPNMHDVGESYNNHINNRNKYTKTIFANSEFAKRTACSSDNNADSLIQQNEFLNNEVNFLSRENVRLNAVLNDIKYNWIIHSDSEIDFVFKKQDLKEKFSQALTNLISNLICGDIDVEELNKFCSSARRSETPKSSELLDDCLFEVDPSAEPVNSGNTSIPMYDASFHEILESPSDSKNASPKTTASIGRSCFNCNEDHHMSKCPHRLNFQKIAIARKRARSNFVPSLRYHVQGKNDCDFKPGIISDELREALGVQKNQIPPYVYHMRVLDYPPGWLCEAAVESSGMILYGSDGNALKDLCEDGEVDTSSVRVQYDPDKLIDYPGFNVPLPPDMIDEFVDLGLPPLQPNQLRCVVEKYMAKPDIRPSRKRKINLTNDKPSKIQRDEEDMEIEKDSDGEDINGQAGSDNDFVPPLPETAPPPLPPPPSSLPPLPDTKETCQEMLSTDFLEDTNSASLVESAAEHFKVSCADFSSGTSSPSLAELVELKKKLVMELDINIDDELSLSADLNDDKTSDGLYILDECEGSDDSNNLSNISDSSSALNKTGDTSERCESLETSTSNSKCIALGTPSLSCHSPYVKLPDYGQFSKNVSAHINFENLPDSTGTYEKMKNVIKKVKNKLNSLIN